MKLLVAAPPETTTAEEVTGNEELSLETAIVLVPLEFASVKVHMAN